MYIYSHICTTASSHVGEERQRLWQRTLRTKNDSSRLWDLGKKGPLLVSADFSIFCTACKFTGKRSHMADLYLIFLGVTFLSSISYCYFQAECTPNRRIYTPKPLSRTISSVKPELACEVYAGKSLHLAFSWGETYRKNLASCNHYLFSFNCIVFTCPTWRFTVV